MTHNKEKSFVSSTQIEITQMEKVHKHANFHAKYTSGSDVKAKDTFHNTPAIQLLGALFLIIKI